MNQQAAAMPNPDTSDATPLAQRATRALLTCGALAGPLWVGVVLFQMLTRPGFDIRRHAVSQLTLGDLGWVQVANFIAAGLLVVAGAAGLRLALRGERAGTWGPLLVAAYGLGLVGAGLFVADPGNGFPPGTPNTPGHLSGHGAMHLLFSSAAFLSLIVASGVVFARRFAALGRRAWFAGSAFTGAYFLVTWIALVATQAAVAGVNLAFAAAVLIGWTWLTLLTARLARRP